MEVLGANSWHSQESSQEIRVVLIGKEEIQSLQTFKKIILSLQFLGSYGHMHTDPKSEAILWATLWTR